VPYGYDSSVAEFDAFRAWLAPAKDCLVPLQQAFTAVHRMQAVRRPVFSDRLVQGSRLDQFGRKRIDVRVATIAEYQPSFSVEYTQPFGDVFEHRLEVGRVQVVAGQDSGTVLSRGLDARGHSQATPKVEA
jgi:hypothetical protein